MHYFNFTQTLQLYLCMLHAELQSAFFCPSTRDTMENIGTFRKT